MEKTYVLTVNGRDILGGRFETYEQAHGEADRYLDEHPDCQKVVISQESRTHCATVSKE